MSMKLFELKREREAFLTKSEAIITAAETAKRNFTEAEQADLAASNAAVETLNARIKPLESRNTVTTFEGMPFGLAEGTSSSRRSDAIVGEHPHAAGFRSQFASWMNNGLVSLGGASTGQHSFERQDAIETLRRMVKWVVEETRDGAELEALAG